MFRGNGGNELFIRPGFSYCGEHLAGTPRFMQVADARFVGGNHNEVSIGDGKPLVECTAAPICFLDATNASAIDVLNVNENKAAVEREARHDDSWI